MKHMGRPGMILGMAALALVFTYGQVLAQPPGGLPPVLSTIAQWQSKYNYPQGFNRYPGDKIIGVEFIGVQSGNVMKFRVEVQVDPAHLHGRDGVNRPRQAPLTGLKVTVVPFDRNGKALYSTLTSETLKYPKPRGSNFVATEANLLPGVHFRQVAVLLVAVWEVSFPSQGPFVKWCDVVKWGNVSERFLRKDIRLRRFVVRAEPATPIRGYRQPPPEEVYKQTQKESPRSGTLVGIKNESYTTVTVFHSNFVGGRGISIRPGKTTNISATGEDLLNGWKATCDKPKDYLKLEIQYFSHSISH